RPTGRSIDVPGHLEVYCRSVWMWFRQEPIRSAAPVARPRGTASVRGLLSSELVVSIESRHASGRAWPPRHPVGCILTLLSARGIVEKAGSAPQNWGSLMIITDFGDLIAARMRSEHRTLATRWFERLVDLLPVGAREIFPTESLLDHVPALILEISEYLREPEDQAIASNTAILEKASELGALRYAQQASLHQVLREYQILGRGLVAFALEELQKAGASPSPAEAVQLVSRLHQAVDVLSQATVEAFVGLYTRTIAEQAERLDEFTRMVAHEWRQPLAALQFAVRLLREASLDPLRHERTLATVERNVQHLADLTLKLEAIARVRSNGDNAVVQTVSVAAVAQEAARQLSEMAEARGVQILVADGSPALTVD